MKLAQTKWIFAGVLAASTVGFGTYQMVNGVPAKEHDTQLKAAKASTGSAPEVQPATFPTVTADPFRPVEAPIVISQMSGDDPARGNVSSSVQSAPVVRPEPVAPLRGPIRELPDASEFREAAPETVTPPRKATLEFKGVIDAGDRLAYISINGERARPFRLGTQISPTVTLAEITHGYITLLIADREVRIRTGQEVELQ